MAVCKFTKKEENSALNEECQNDSVLLTGGFQHAFIREGLIAKF